MDNNRQFLNEEQYQKTAKKLKLISKIMIGVGVIGFLVCSVLLFGNFLDFEQMGGIGFLWVGCGALAGFGMVIAFMAYGREIAAFQAQQHIPVAKEGIEEIAPSAGVAAKEIAKGIKEGINEADAENEEK